MKEHRAWILVVLLSSHGCAQGVTPGHFDVAETLGPEASVQEYPRADLGASPPGPCLSDAPETPCFRATMVLPVSPDPRFASIADVTGDGVDDLVLAAAAVGVVQVLSKPHWGGFDRERVLTVGGPIDAVATADLDGDGVHDVIAHERGEAALAVFWGTDLQAEPWPIELPARPTALDSRSRPDDARDELVLAFEDGTFRRLDLGADPSMSAAVALAEPAVEVACAPLGFDARPLVALSDAGTINVLQAPGLHVLHVLDAGARAAVLADVTGDERVDVVFRANLGPPRLLLDVRAGVASPRALAADADAVAVTLCDLDDDGRSEIVWADADARLHIDGWDHGVLVERLVLELEGVPTSLASGDLDGDGWPDIAAVHNETHTVELLTRRR